MLKREGGFDVDTWTRRLGALRGGADEEAGAQEDLFTDG
jgi:hypothetical protein